jgi:hypothetical protein
MSSPEKNLASSIQSGLPAASHTFNVQVGEILFTTLTFIVIFIIFVFIIQFSWNNSMAEIFKDQVRQINLTESFFLLVLARILTA